MADGSGLYTAALRLDRLIEGLVKVAPKVFQVGENVELRVMTTFGMDFHLSLTPPAAFAADPRLQAFLKQCQTHPSLGCKDAVIRRNQAGNPSQQAQQEISLNYTSEDGVVGRFTMNAAGDKSRLLLCLGALESEFNPTNYIDLIRERAERPVDAALQIRERTVADLQAAVEKLGALQAKLVSDDAEARQKLRAQLEKEYADRRSDFERDIAQQRTELERHAQATATAANEALQKRQLQLDEEKRAHEAKVKDFDLRESKGVRRELLDRIEKVLENVDQFRLTDETGKKRTFVHQATWALLFITFSVAAVFDGQLVRDVEHWKAYALFGLGSSITFVSTFVYYLKWNDRWFREHADAEFQAKRYKADILRASWVAELVAEASQDGKRSVPTRLLTAFTRNLFAGDGTSSESAHPLCQHS